MVEAHLSSLMAIGLPFRTPNGMFDFSTYSEIVSKMKSSIPTMLKERLAPPPEDSYSLHRKLSGAFLLCSRLRACIDCGTLLEKYVIDATGVRQDLLPYPT